MERARHLAAGDSDSRLARKPSGDYGFSGSDTETFGFGNDFSPSPVQSDNEAPALPPRSRPTSFAEDDEANVPRRKKNRKRGSAFFKKRTPDKVLPLPDEDEFWDAELNIQEIGTVPESCLPLCRYKNILPHPHTRVVLNDAPGLTAEEQEESKFINASYISNFRKTNPQKYIATQGPKPSTQDHFWRMIWEQNTALIVMVTGLWENGKTKCHAYWPDDKGSSLTILPTNMRVSNLGVATMKNVNVSCLELELNDEKRTVTHLQFLGWPDQGVPKSVKSLTDTIEMVQEHSMDPAGPPIVVHCSAGVGRTGVIIAVDMGIELLIAGMDVDVFAIMMEMRKQRTCMIQTYEQLEFVYRLLCRWSKSNMPDTSTSAATEDGYALPAITGTSKTAPPSPESTPARVPSATKVKVLEAAITKAESLTNILPPGYVHHSQLNTEEADDATLPGYRVQQKEGTQHLQDNFMMEKGNTRAANRYFEKKHKEVAKRNSAVDLLKLVETLEDDPVAGAARDGPQISSSTPDKLTGGDAGGPNESVAASPGSPSTTPSLRKLTRHASKRASKRQALVVAATATLAPHQMGSAKAAAGGRQQSTKQPFTRKKSFFHKAGAAVLAVSHKAGAAVSRLGRSGSVRHKDLEDEDEEDENAEDSADTLAFMAQLNSNRAQRAAEEARHKAELVEKARADKVKNDAIRAAEIVKIQAAQAIENERKERETDAVVADAQARMGELVFDFSFN